jgi:hypothetical protein
VFPVRYELNLYILFRRNSVFKGLIRHQSNFTFLPYLYPLWFKSFSLIFNAECSPWLYEFAPDEDIYTPEPVPDCITVSLRVDGNH